MLLPGKSALMRKLLLMLMAMGFRRNPDRFLSQMKDAMAEPDKLLLAQPDVVQAFIYGVREAFRSGTRGAYRDAILYKRPWGYQLQDISMQIHLWHGELDLNVPISVGHYIADAIPNCHATLLKDEAHISLPHNHIQEILSILI